MFAKNILSTAAAGLLFLALCNAFPVSGSITSPELYVPVKSSQLSQNLFKCDSANLVHRALCQEALKKVNAELEAAGISIDSNGLLFVHDDPTDRPIDTGKSCTVTAEQKHLHLEARIKSSTKLRLSGNSLTEPFILRLKVPVSLNGKVDVKQRFGVKVPKISGFKIKTRCQNYGSDSYSLKGSLNTNANIALGFYLKPSLGTTDAGDYAVVIHPIIRAMTTLESTDIKLRAHGVSPIAAVWNSIVGLASTTKQLVDAALNGKSISDVLETNLKWDIGSAIVLGTGSLPAPLERAMWQLLSVAGNYFARKKASEYGKDLELDLNEKIRRALKVKDDGSRVFVIKKSFMHLLNVQGEQADIFLSETSNGGWTPQNLIASRPKVAGPAPTAAPSRPTQSRSRSCYSHASTTCGQCEGCSECVYLMHQCDILLGQELSNVIKQ